jgi:hypothetical protein
MRIGCSLAAAFKGSIGKLFCFRANWDDDWDIESGQ